MFKHFDWATEETYFTRGQHKLIDLCFKRNVIQGHNITTLDLIVYKWRLLLVLRGHWSLRTANQAS